jgi:lysophospholipase L1-like esterase
MPRGWIAVVPSIVAGVLGMSTPEIAAQEPGLIPPSDPRVSLMGRVDATDSARIRLGYPGVTLRLRFLGPSLSVRTLTTTPNSHLDVIVDGGEPRVIHLPQGETETALALGLAGGEHLVEIVHRTETWVGVITLVGFRLAPEGRLLDPPPLPRRRMLFIGDSVTCAEGVDRIPGHKQGRPAGWNPRLSYGMLLARTLGAQCHLVCYGGRGLIRDWAGRRDVLQAPQLFDLALPEELAPPAWDHSAYVPDVVVVSLGTNDFNLGIGDFPESEEWVGAYVRFAQAIRGRYPQAHIFLTEGAIVDDAPGGRPQKSVLRSYIAQTVERLADPRVHVLLSQHYPGDAGDAHPPAAAHAAMARDMEPIIRAAAGW